jgi:hypothetical protein
LKIGRISEKSMERNTTVLKLNFLNLFLLKIYLYFGAIVPFGLLICLNSMIIHRATRHSSSTNTILTLMFSRRTTSVNPSMQTNSEKTLINLRNKRKTEMTRSILILTFTYIIFSLPNSIVNGYFYLDIISRDIGRLVIILVANIQFTFPALNFITLLYSNKLFAKEFRKLIRRKKKKPKQLGGMSMSNVTNNKN